MKLLTVRHTTRALVALACLAASSAHAQTAVSTRQVREATERSTPGLLDTVRVSGRVTLGAGERDTSRLELFIHDNEGGVYVSSLRTHAGVVVREGDSVDVVGTIRRRGDFNGLHDAAVSVHAGARRVDDAIALPDLLPETLDGAVKRLVTIETRVVSRFVGRGDHVLGVAQNDYVDSRVEVADLAEDGAEMRLARFLPGDRIRVTGVLIHRTNVESGESRYIIYPRTAAEVVPIGTTAAQRRRLWWTGLTALILAGLGLAVARYRAAIREHRRQHEATLRESAASYRRLIEHAPAGIILCREHQIVFANDEFARIVGAPSALDLCGRDVYDFLSEDEHSRAAAYGSGEDAARGKVIPTGAWRFRRMDGEIVDTELTSSVVTFAGKSALQSVVHDVSERRRAARALAESEARFRLVSRATNDVIWDWNIGTDALWWSESTASVFGYSQAEIGASLHGWADKIHPDDRDRVTKSFQDAIDDPSRQSWSGEYRFRKSDGSYATVGDRGYILRDATGRATRMIGALQDHTTRIHLETQLRHAQKLEAVGQLAAGVAHDFNNVLTAISTFSSLVLEDLPADSPSRADVEEIQSAGKRAATLTRQLLAISRRDFAERAVFDINDAVRETETLLRRTMSSGIAIELSLSARPALVLADKGQISQVIMNLAINARDAMAKDGGVLTIETSVFDESKTASAGRNGVVEPRVLLVVRDTGTGMDAATQARVFEPFFTTKAPGQGTGLGLATVYGIVTEADGEVWMQSDVGRGTSFFVALPLQIAAEPDSTPAPHSPESGSKAVILLVEDEVAVRAAVSRTLVRQGFAVLQAKDAEDALVVWKHHMHEIDAIVSDVVMPGMRGPDLIERLREDRPGVPAVLVSGYTDHAVSDLRSADTFFLSKPFALEELAEALRTIISAAPALVTSH